ncbi:flavoprotein HI0933-like protein [Gottschalkia acidurici 9a]|uniref:Flavoprotein HI0933-like protein n=1 Tax=Gottschalkia acidurici (strain ATCC 7906 / DSM 604 / BCRC 14475 / CIP 104303 / KCTC 5404 / NCIMB 10678 / 9a) TaxID=1128398 RepID=K0AXB5_GOTA9|nr:NAD(P)/FAD-dependent oxidoreductase [Gottschalkia acidurici]AFS78443.1 flavoprotein HI0933-like protein [Gottschalkia acidurici 9a]
MSEKVAVIGGGPAGMIAAGTAGSLGKSVTIFEKNEKLGRKMFITGKGRCNITNNADIEVLIENVVNNNTFLYSSFYTFTNQDIINLLNNYGVKVKTERGNRVFPESDKSSDVIKALERYLKENNVKIKLNQEVKKIVKNNELFFIEFPNGKIESFDKVIIATGGKSYEQTGSTGDGYVFAKNFNHTIKNLKPALVPCEVKESFIKELQGLSLKNVRIYSYVNNKKVFEDFGEMLFTHYGISGPIVLTMSNYINKYTSNNTNIEIVIDLKPALDEQKLENRIINDFEKYSKKQFKNSLDDLLPIKLIPIIVRLSEIPEDKFVNQITKEERKNLIKLLKGFKLTFSKFRPLNEAIVTSGGVSTLEIDSSTMESKIVSGLYFAGEVIDVDALTGGFNLQIAYSTGYIAGLNC